MAGEMCVDYMGMQETFGRRRGDVVNERCDQPELSSSTMQEGDRCYAIDTQPNELPLLVRYAEETGLEETKGCFVEGEEDAHDSELIEIEKEQFCLNRNTRKENPRVVIQIGKEHSTENLCERVDPLKNKARTANVGEGDHGTVKRAFVRVDGRQLRRLMSPGEDRLVRKQNKVQVLVQIHNPGHSHGQHLEGEGEGSEMDHSVQILDIAPLVEKGFVSPFVSSKKFHTSMVEEGSREGEGPTASDVFRQEVLRILRKPFDMEEYRKLREAIRVGTYLDHHQDVKRKLKTFRHKWGKCLVILRCFFYWLENLTREGAFQPWTDRQCLAVEPPPPPPS